MRENGKLLFCMLRNGDLWFMLNRRAGTATRPKDFEGIRLYWAPTDIHGTRERLKTSGTLFPNSKSATMDRLNSPLRTKTASPTVLVRPRRENEAAQSAGPAKG